jgi:hypothetical protein
MVWAGEYGDVAGFEAIYKNGGMSWLLFRKIRAGLHVSGHGEAAHEDHVFTFR